MLGLDSKRLCCGPGLRSEALQNGEHNSIDTAEPYCRTALQYSCLAGFPTQPVSTLTVAILCAYMAYHTFGNATTFVSIRLNPLQHMFIIRLHVQGAVWVFAWLRCCACTTAILLSSFSGVALSVCLFRVLFWSPSVH